MQLTEAEIVAEIVRIIDDAHGTVVRYDGHSIGEYRSASENAAHAIAEKMAEGVVAQRQYIIRHAPYPDPAAALMICSYLTMVGDTGYGHEGEYIWLDNSRIASDGQLVTVTVSKKEEGDVQGNNS